jgi:hypothetical protein
VSQLVTLFSLRLYTHKFDTNTDKCQALYLYDKLGYFLNGQGIAKSFRYSPTCSMAGLRYNSSAIKPLVSVHIIKLTWFL